MLQDASAIAREESGAYRVKVLFVVLVHLRQDLLQGLDIAVLANVVNRAAGTEEEQGCRGARMFQPQGPRFQSTGVTEEGNLLIHEWDLVVCT